MKTFYEWVRENTWFKRISIPLVRRIYPQLLAMSDADGNFLPVENESGGSSGRLDTAQDRRDTGP